MQNHVRCSILYGFYVVVIGLEISNVIFIYVSDDGTKLFHFFHDFDDFCSYLRINLSDIMKFKLTIYARSLAEV